MSPGDDQSVTGGNGEAVENGRGVVICQNDSGVVKGAERTRNAIALRDISPGFQSHKG